MVKTVVVVALTMGLFLATGAAAKTADPIELKQVKPLPVLCQWVVSTRVTVGRDLGLAYRELDAFVRAKKIAVAGPALAIYHTAPGPKWRIEACLPLRAAPTASGPFRFQTIPGGPAAVLRRRGPYKDMPRVYLELWKWINHRGYKPAGPPREFYVASPPQVKDPAKFVTLIVWPVRQVRCSPN